MRQLTFLTCLPATVHQTDRCFNSSLKREILDSSKLKGTADENLRFDENGSKFSKQVENTDAKGENCLL